MNPRISFLAATLLTSFPLILISSARDLALSKVDIICPPDAPANVQLAAKEIRRYVYLRTGELLPIHHDPAERSDQTNRIRVAVDAVLGPQQYRLKSAGRSLTISGGGDVAVLYGAYAFVEKLGVRFYLHGDVVPDGKIPFELPVLDETRQPLFALRGVNPWGWHPFGMDAWSADDYKAIISQLAKLRMNFIGIHTYPEGHPQAEPTVWHGLTGDFGASGQVTHSYVSRYFNTLVGGKPWGDYLARSTSDYGFGGALLFDDDAWSPDVMRDQCPLPQTPEGCNDVFNRMGAQFDDAFTFARQLGVKTCLGTETPLTIPQAVARRSTDVRAVYEGTFRRIMARHPLDYYWLWTPESWRPGNSPQQYSSTVADIKLAIEAAKIVKAPFQLATCGWVLGPVQNRAAYDADLPKSVAVSAISRELGTHEVESAFGRIVGREKWAIPWLENDVDDGLAGLQLTAGQMRRDAADALTLGCTGLMGLHWRTDIISPNVSALAQAAWDQSWNKDRLADIGKQRSLPCDDFYADWAQASFGLPEAGKVFAAMDGRVPRSLSGGCPTGLLTPATSPWPTIAPRFAFVDEFEKLRPLVHGPGNLDRFDYWLNTFKHLRALAHLRCALANPDATELATLYADAYRHLLATVNTPGGLAMVVNMENHPGWGAAIAKHATQPWPKEYQGAPRLIVPTVRTVVTKGEPLKLKIIALVQQPVKSVTVHIRPLGKGEWKAIQSTHAARAVYEAKLPPAMEDFEYYITAGQDLIWPSTAPDINQSVVVVL